MHEPAQLPARRQEIESGREQRMRVSGPRRARGAFQEIRADDEAREDGIDLAQLPSVRTGLQDRDDPVIPFEVAVEHTDRDAVVQAGHETREALRVDRVAGLHEEYEGRVLVLLLDMPHEVVDRAVGEPVHDVGRAVGGCVRDAPRRFARRVPIRASAVRPDGDQDPPEASHSRAKRRVQRRGRATGCGLPAPHRVIEVVAPRREILGRQGVFRVEPERGLSRAAAPLGLAMLRVVNERVALRRRDIGIGVEIPSRVELRRGIAAFRGAAFEEMDERIGLGFHHIRYVAR